MKALSEIQEQNHLNPEIRSEYIDLKAKWIKFGVYKNSQQNRSAFVQPLDDADNPGFIIKT